RGVPVYRSRPTMAGCNAAGGLGRAGSVGRIGQPGAWCACRAAGPALASLRGGPATPSAAGSVRAAAARRAARAGRRLAGRSGLVDGVAPYRGSQRAAAGPGARPDTARAAPGRVVRRGAAESGATGARRIHLAGHRRDGRGGADGWQPCRNAGRHRAYLARAPGPARQGAGADRAGPFAGLDRGRLAAAVDAGAGSHGARSHGRTLAHPGGLGRSDGGNSARGHRHHAHPAHRRYRYLSGSFMFSWLAILLTGMAGGALAWLFIGPVRRPVSDARARPAVGWGWRLCWPWLDAVAQPCATALPWRWRDALTRWLAQAGTPAAITAPHTAALVACAAGLGASAGGVLGGLVLPAPGAWLCGIGGALAMAGWPILWI